MLVISLDGLVIVLVGDVRSCDSVGHFVGWVGVLMDCKQWIETHYQFAIHL